MSIHELFVGIALLLTAGGTLPYLYHIYTGKGKPSRSSWVIWTTFNSLVCVATLMDGNVHAQMVVIALSNLLILTYGWNRSEQSERRKNGDHNTPNWSNLDRSCLWIGVMGIAIWLFVQDPLWAVVIGLSVNTIALIPTATKTWKAPQSEAPWGYAAMVAACTAMLIALSHTPEPSLVAILPSAVYGTTSALMLATMLMPAPARARMCTLGMALGCLSLTIVRLIMNLFRATQKSTPQ